MRTAQQLREDGERTQRFLHGFHEPNDDQTDDYTGAPLREDQR